MGLESAGFDSQSMFAQKLRGILIEFIRLFCRGSIGERWAAAAARISLKGKLGNQ